MNALESEQIAEMTMQPKNKIIRITGVLKDNNKTFIVQVPDNTEIVADIANKATDQGILKVAEEEQPSAFLNSSDDAAVSLDRVDLFLLVYKSARRRRRRKSHELRQKQSETVR